MSRPDPARHYDRVTEAWRKWVMGEELHFGLFTSSTEGLAEATRRLTDHLADKAELEPGLEVLDVGCGVGTPAMLLAEERGCRVTGISTSQVGVELARARAVDRGIADRVRFLVADATSNELPDASFDRVFSLESAHLMEDKEALFGECFRVLRPGGRLALCDVCLVGSWTSEAAQIARYVALGHSPPVAARMRDAVHATIHRSFGSSKLTHAESYVAAAASAGFEKVAWEDLSPQTRPTLERWGRNASEHWAQIESELGSSYLSDWFLALLHMSSGWGQSGGYLLLTAEKP